MRLLIFIASTLFTVSCSSSKKAFSVEKFKNNLENVMWLYAYNGVAQVSTDSLLAKPESERQDTSPAEWFCFIEDSTWYAVYGRYDSLLHMYKTPFVYVVTAEENARQIQKVIDTSLANPYARALINAENQMSSLIPDFLRFNKYIRKEGDNTFSVWILPAYQAVNKNAVYGGEFFYQFDSTGNILLAKREYRQKNFRGFKLDALKEIYLDYKDLKDPTVGGLFFLWYYKEYFKSVHLELSAITIDLLYDPSKGGYYFYYDKDKKLLHKK